MKQNIWGKRVVWIPAVAVLAGLVFLLTGCGAAPIRQQNRVDTAMGTIMTQTLYVQQGREQSALKSEPEDRADEESASIMQLLADLEQQELSWRIESSEVARINAQNAMGEEANVIFVSSSMQEILGRIWQVSDDSGGALDVTLGRLSRLWNLDELAVSAGGGNETLSDSAEALVDEGAPGDNEAAGKDSAPGSEALWLEIPALEQIQSALGDTGYERVQFAEEKISLPGGMQLDLGAVGKGLACDRISAYLHSQPQVTGAVVAVGGSVITYGQKPDGSPWKVAIMHPREEGSYLGILSLTGEHYVSTSGDYERYVMMDGVRYHHILDPSTGYPARSGLCSVTIVCDNGLLADALSTACFVLGSEQGLTLAENYGAEALLVDESGALYMTEGMGEIFSVGR